MGPFGSLKKIKDYMKNVFFIIAVLLRYQIVKKSSHPQWVQKHALKNLSFKEVWKLNIKKQFLTLEGLWNMLSHTGIHSRKPHYFLTHGLLSYLNQWIFIRIYSLLLFISFYFSTRPEGKQDHLLLMLVKIMKELYTVLH